ncbi:DUF4867 family protein [Propionivibrio soli]|uniref:DUF4867 family protein n=1 Tax=Propionivibrio soli TaxID=2976531 RepID=UPI0021E6D90C|nr:DUF4867 family protein [Propionivibrio soli]
MKEKLQALNPHLPVHHVADAAFALYGRVLPGYNFTGWLRYLEKQTLLPAEGNIYIPGDPELEALPPFEQVRDTLFAGMPIQAGYCNGNSSLLNGLEYHKSIEVVVAQTDLVLQLADYGHLVNFTMDVKHVEAFFVPTGTALELKPTALHLAPSRVSDAGFKAVIVLPLGTNTDLPPQAQIQREDPESRLLFRKGKWMLAHPDNQVALSRGAVAALIGPNLRINYQ